MLCGEGRNGSVEASLAKRQEGVGIPARSAGGPRRPWYRRLANACGRHRGQARPQLAGVDADSISMRMAVMLPSLLRVPLTRIWLPTLTALAAADWPDCVYWVLAVEWIVTELPSTVLPTMVWPCTLETVSRAPHRTCP